MVKKYGQLLSEGASLWTKNIRVLIPILIFSIISSTVFLLLSSFFLVPPEQISASWILNMIFYACVSMVVSLIIYGWSFALIEQSVLKKKFTLMGQLKPGLRKGWTQFLVLLLYLLMFAVLLVVFFFGIVLFGIGFSLLPEGLEIIQIAMAIVGVVIFIAALGILVTYSVQVTAVLIMEDIGAIASLKRSWTHFRNNKKHSFALMGLFFIFMILASVPNLAASIFLFDFNEYGKIQQAPMLYASINAITSLPVVLIMFWMLYVIALAYQDRKKVSQR